MTYFMVERIVKYPYVQPPIYVLIKHLFLSLAAHHLHHQLGSLSEPFFGKYSLCFFVIKINLRFDTQTKFYNLISFFHSRVYRLFRELIIICFFFYLESG